MTTDTRKPPDPRAGKLCCNCNAPKHINSRPCCGSRSCPWWTCPRCKWWNDARGNVQPGPGAEKRATA